MIDRNSRDKFAESLRHLAAGQITNDDFSDNLPLHSKDRAVNRIFWSGAWHLYDDLREHKLVGKYRLSKEMKHEVARWILFLKSDLEYVYPRWLSVIDFFYPLLVIFSLGLAIPLIKLAARAYADPRIWPFANDHDLQQALANPSYLNVRPNPSINTDWPQKTRPAGYVKRWAP